MKLKDLGEERIVAWICGFLGKPKGVPVGVGDDAAVIRVGGTYLAFCSDMIHDGHDIYKGMSPYQAGRKVAVVNFSDLASMGATPAAFLSSISIGQNEEFSKLKEIMRGVEAACRDYDAHFLGGDMDSGDVLIMDGCAVGTIPRRREIMTRKGARVGDIVAVTGYLGSAACGWQVQQKGLDLKKLSVEERARVERHIVSACLEPKARVREGRILARSGAVTACTDISDGLARSLGYMRDGCGFEIHEWKVPIRKEFHRVCDRFKLDKELLAYHIGEDFELLCTIKPKKFAALKKKLPGLREIGVVTEGNKIKLMKKDGSSADLRPSGYDHFSKVKV
jgi:thiamine-monophosphate kinase